MLFLIAILVLLSAATGFTYYRVWKLEKKWVSQQQHSHIPYAVTPPNRAYTTQPKLRVKANSEAMEIHAELARLKEEPRK